MDKIKNFLKPTKVTWIAFVIIGGLNLSSVILLGSVIGSLEFPNASNPIMATLYMIVMAAGLAISYVAKPFDFVINLLLSPLAYLLQVVNVSGFISSYAIISPIISSYAIACIISLLWYRIKSRNNIKTDSGSGTE